jgi:folate-dependent tRNA-U54 methylase TrmFO/GidA
MRRNPINKEELKTIALTSAIAAAGTAVATAGVGYLLDRYVFTEEVTPATPTFVVVPVVNYPVPELPAPEPTVMAGYGALGQCDECIREANMKALVALGGGVALGFFAARML